MRIAVTGSIATDHLMVFPGRFAEQLVPDRLAAVSLSFLVDSLDVRPGGAGANAAYGLALLRYRPALVGAVGADFREHGDRLAALGVDTGSVHVSATRRTARYLCTTDGDRHRIASFHPGAMSEAAGIGLAETARRLGGLDLVLVGADDPGAMVRHTEECRAAGLPFAAGPSRQLALLERDAVRRLVDGAALLFTNARESALLLRRTGWSRAEVLRRTGTWITTLGADGCRLERAGEPPVGIAAVPPQRLVDPTGAGDAFRAGFLAGLAAGLAPVRCAQTGSALASFTRGAAGGQEYACDPERLVAAVQVAYGPRAAAEIAHALAVPRRTPTTEAEAETETGAGAETATGVQRGVRR
ncbi:PfkB family carbohydrate kinase [Streptomyces sp. FIT100]|uniref:PfkB family carbohydrate kinase n=1 Tax=Streptomyces sp. FIT100 TaxID=2837956 RepID=UPI0021CA9EA8|nr:PfkB family carbohydrate kinase [Streptomyces sp. FIT100]UUN27433.1 carbohydrate kinase family protein [Streptomyces sp. FIT100]